MNKVLMMLMLVCCMLAGCGKPPVGAGGGGSETVAVVTSVTEGIRITITSDDSLTTDVSVCSNRYSSIDTTAFHVRKTLSGRSAEWMVEVAPGEELVISAIIVGKGSAVAIEYTPQDNIRGERRAEFSASGSLEGTVTEKLTDGTIRNAALARVAIAGTYFATSTDKDGFYRFGEVPAGSYSIRAATSQKSTANYSLDTPVVISGDTTSVFNVVLVYQ